jgi:hypothetical protein
LHLPFFRRQSPARDQLPPAVTGFIGRGRDAPTRSAAEFLTAYKTMPWLRAVVDKVATSTAAAEWHLYDGSRLSPSQRRFLKARAIEDARRIERRRLMLQLRQAGLLREITDHPFLDLLDGRFTTFTGPATRKLLQIHLELVGEAAWFLEMNAAGAPAAAWPIPPTWIKKLPTPQSPSWLIEYSGVRLMPAQDEVFFVSQPAPDNPYGRGTATSYALVDELEIDEFAAKYVKQFFFNRARPDIIVSAEGLDQSEADRLEQYYLNRHGSIFNAFRPFFVNRKLDIKEIGHDFSSMQFIELRKHERDVIREVYGFPPEIFGIIENSNRATIEASDYLYSRWVVYPRLDFLRAAFQEWLIPRYDPRLIIDFDSPVLEDKQFKLQVMRAAPGAFTIDEFRDLAGLEPLPNGDGQIFLMPQNIRPADTPAAPASAPQEERITSRALPTFPTSTIRAVDWEEVIAESAAALSNAFQSAVQEHREGVSRDAIRDAIRAQSLLGLMLSLDLDSLEAALIDGAEMRTALNDALVAGGQAEAETREEFVFHPDDPMVEEEASNHASELASLLIAGTRQGIEGSWQTIRSLDADRDADVVIRLIGLNAQDISAVLQVLSPESALTPAAIETRAAPAEAKALADDKLLARANRMAAYQTRRAAVRGKEIMWEMAVRDGYVKRRNVVRVWVTSGGPRVCPACQSMSGAEVGLKEAWDTPRGPVSTPSLIHPDCYCSEDIMEVPEE